MAKFDKSDIEVREFPVFEDKIFLSEEELIKYIDSCDANFTTYNFYRDSDDIFEFSSRSELLDAYGDDEDALTDAAGEFDVNVDELVSKYDIHCRRGHATGSGREYTLYGTYGNLKKFANEYCGYIDLGNPGEHLSDCEEFADVDFESGDEDYILGNLSM